MADFRVFRCIVILGLLGPATFGLKIDYGLGYEFKHDPNMKEREHAEKLTSERIRSAVSGIGSGAVFPEPFIVPDTQTKFSGATMHFSDIRVYGVDRIRPLQVNSDFTNLMATVTLSMDQLSVLGRFRMTPWVANSDGNFNFTITDAWLTLEAELMFLNEGKDDEGLHVSDIRNTQLTYDELLLNLDNIGILSTILKPVRASLSRHIYSRVKSNLCNAAELNFRNILNKVLTNLPKECPHAVNPVDRAILRARKSMKSSSLDPVYIADDYPKSSKLFKVELTQGKLNGLSGLKRIEPIIVGLERHSVRMRLNLGVGNLKGEYGWTWIIWRNLMTHRGILKYNVQDIKVKVELVKYYNTEDNVNTTIVDNVKMTVGNVNLVSEGIGAVKYIFETFLNVVPDNFRQKITDAAEYRIHKVLENEFQQIDLEQLVEDYEETPKAEGA